MTDAPFAAVGVTEQPRGGEEEPAPRPAIAAGLGPNLPPVIALPAPVKPSANVQMVSTQPELPVHYWTSQAPLIRTDSVTAIAANASRYQRIMQIPAKRR
jgi:hypothetical protein